jgi:hypothetical protein
MYKVGHYMSDTHDRAYELEGMLELYEQIIDSFATCTQDTDRNRIHTQLLELYLTHIPKNTHKHYYTTMKTDQLFDYIKSCIDILHRIGGSLNHTTNENIIFIKKKFNKE